MLANLANLANLADHISLLQIISHSATDIRSGWKNSSGIIALPTNWRSGPEQRSALLLVFTAGEFENS